MHCILSITTSADVVDISINCLLLQLVFSLQSARSLFSGNGRAAEKRIFESKLDFINMFISS